MIGFLEKIPIVAFVNQHSHFLNRKFVFLTILSGLSSTAIVALVNNSASKVEPTFDLISFLIFAIILFSFIFATKTLMDITFVVTESSVNKVRQILFWKLRLCDLEFFEENNTERLYDQIMKSTATVAQTGAYILATGPELILILLVFIYIFFLSKTAFFISLAIISVATYIYIRRSGEVEKCFVVAAGEDRKMGGILSGLLFGFKECLLNSFRDHDLANDFNETSTRVSDSRVLAGKNFSNIYAFVQIFFYILIAIIVFLMPILGWTQATSPTFIFRLVAAVFFVFIPTANVVRMFNYNTQVSVAIQQIKSLEEIIDQRLHDNGVNLDTAKKQVVQVPEFKNLAIYDLEYSYYDADRKTTFSVGPLSFQLRKGEVVFICGGNGSGKTTFLKLLSGLYRPETGTIKSGDQKVIFHDNQSYRELFAAVFSDFFLFQKLYGLYETDERRTTELLALFNLSHKTKREDNFFSAINLSSGQKKRLALIVAMMEDKPVYIFDEWAADQDPAFREYFYFELLPSLKAEGKTIIAVTHDDRYFKYCDRLLRFQDGDIVEEKSLGSKRIPKKRGKKI